MLWQHLKQTIHVQKPSNVDTKAIPKWWGKKELIAIYYKHLMGVIVAKDIVTSS